jgi:hypothetical protein
MHMDSSDMLVHVPMTLVDGRVYVDASVNGRGPFRFAVDTGASGIGRVDARLVTLLGLTRGHPAVTSDAVKTRVVDTIHLDALALGKVVRQDVDLITRDYRAHLSRDAGFDGILGREFFADGLLVIDYAGRELSFSRTLGLSRSDGHAMAYERAFRIPITIGGKPY